MLLKGLAGFARLTNLFMNIIVGIAVGVTIMVVTAVGLPMQMILVMFTQALFLSVFVGYFVGDLLPALDWGMKLAEALKINRKLVVRMVMCAVLAIVNVTIIAFTCSFLNLMVSQGFLAAFNFFLMIWIPALIAGYAVIVIALPYAQALAAKISGFNPAER